MTAPLQ